MCASSFPSTQEIRSDWISSQFSPNMSVSFLFVDENDNRFLPLFLSFKKSLSSHFQLQFQMSKIFCLFLSSLDGKDAAFLDTVLYAGCEVHRFDPSGRGSREPASIKNHRAWLDWRNPRRHAGLVGNVQHRLLDIMDSLGHTMVDVLRMDLESAEWRILESWIKDGTLRRINQLILTIHMQWAGFEVGGAEEEVVRFWYSVLRALRISGLRLVHSAHGPGHIVLRHKLADSHSSYTLSWIRTSEQPR
uniref:Methyltransferase domain-containing protein n=1 Tax=Cyprinus carpio TaxID=7962 RepID=A0A8C2G6A4_CYPCA